MLLAGELVVVVVPEPVDAAPELVDELPSVVAASAPSVEELLSGLEERSDDVPSLPVPALPPLPFVLDDPLSGRCSSVPLAVAPVLAEEGSPSVADDWVASLDVPADVDSVEASSPDAVSGTSIDAVTCTPAAL